MANNTEITSGYDEQLQIWFKKVFIIANTIYRDLNKDKINKFILTKFILRY